MHRIAGLLLIFISVQAFAQEKPQEEGVYMAASWQPLGIDQLPSVQNLFDTQEVLHVEIETNMQKLLQFKDDPDYQKAWFTITLKDTIKVVKKVRIKVRGKTRVTICDDPPLKIDFKKTDFQWEWFDKLKALKLVTPCDDPKIYTRYLMKEYFAYKGYAAITDHSYRVRMIQLTLSDTQGNMKPEVKYAFLVENDKKLAKRTGTKEIEMDDITAGQLVSKFYLQPTEKTLHNMSVLSLYQYMIGNTDWTTNQMHNVKVFTRGEELIPVPYDFDYAGVVNANYAVPNSSTPLDNVRERHYLGPCASKETFETALDVVLGKQDAILHMLEDDPFISTKTKTDIRSYISEFFEMMEDTANHEQVRLTNCTNQ